MSGEAASSREGGNYVGWVAAGIVLAIVFAAATALWFMFHP